LRQTHSRNNHGDIQQIGRTVRHPQFGAGKLLKTYMSGYEWEVQFDTGRRFRLLASETEQIGISLHLAEQLSELPPWNNIQIERYLQETFRLYEPLLDLGPFQNLLPLRIRQHANIRGCDVCLCREPPWNSSS
jgi:hypothetical protein